jgi:hypothetical protein
MTTCAEAESTDVSNLALKGLAAAWFARKEYLYSHHYNLLTLKVCTAINGQ